jgi:hypothetical protein
MRLEAAEVQSGAERLNLARRDREWVTPTPDQGEDSREFERTNAFTWSDADEEIAGKQGQLQDGLTIVGPPVHGSIHGEEMLDLAFGEISSHFLLVM